MKRILFYTTLVLVFFGSCANDMDSAFITSPDKSVKLTFWIEEGTPYYAVDYKDTEVITKSKLGFVLKGNDTISTDMAVVSDQEGSFNETWEQPWGESQFVENNYNDYTIKLQQKSGNKRKLNIAFKVYNDGVGFQYTIPEQEGLDSIIILDELTEFDLSGNHQAWWIPAYQDNRYEYVYSKSPVNKLDTVHTPLTMEAADGMHICIHEAALVNFASMTLVSEGISKLKCDLAPWSDGVKVRTKGSAQSSWRTILIGENAGELVTSNLILNLNEPNKIEDMSWIKPTKYLGIWWGMHIGKYSFWEGPKHGASTKNSKEHIDLCNKLGIDHLLIEGWNKGWTMAWYENLLHEFSFTQSTDDFDFKEVSDYARDHNVNLIGYHETGSNIDNYMSQIDAGMQMYKDAGMHSVKIGQVGSRLMLKEWHYGQYGVNYYNYVLQKAANYQLSVNFHEPIKFTGLQRTYPHLMAGEGSRGQEYNAWSEGNPPEHTVILPFTRLIGGPMDFTPGIFAIKGTRLHTTLAKQLAIYVAFYSPIQMLADLPENYVDHPAFKFLADVPVSWAETKVLDAKIGDYYTVARKDRNSDDWYLGSITDEEAREFTVALDFLEDGKKYKAEIYADAADAEYDKNPEAYEITSEEVDNTSELTIKLAKGGGQAIRFVAI